MDFKRLAPILVGLIIFLGIIALAVSCSHRSSKEEATLFYVDGSNFTLVPVSILLEGPVTAQKALEALIAGENQGNWENLIPKDTRVLSTENKKNSIVVNLSKEFEGDKRGPTSSRLQVMAVVNTAAKASGFKYVKILIEGEEKPLFNDEVYIKDAIQKDDSLVK